MTDRVAITGLGAVSSLGLDLESHLHQLEAGTSGVGLWDGPEPRGTGVAFACAVRGFRPRKLIANRMLRKLLQPSGAYAVVAAGEALAAAGLGGDDPEAVERRHGAGLWLGSPSWDLPSAMFAPALRASFDRDEQFSFERYGRHAMNLVDPLLIVKGLPNAALCGIAIEHGICGPNANVANGPVGGLQALLAAAAAIRRGEVTVAIAGGADSLLRGEHVIAEVLAGRAWTGEDPREDPNARYAARPFAQGRRGYRLGEGAAICVLEGLDRARSRGARILAVLGDDGQSAAVPGLDPVLPRAARQAVASRGADAVFGQGLGSPRDDVAEAATVRDVVGFDVPLTGATAAIGYTGAASGAFAVVHATAAITRGRLPPTLGSTPPDPDCAANIIRSTTEHAVDRALAWAMDDDHQGVAVTLERAP